MKIIDDDNTPELIKKISRLSNTGMQIGIFGADDGEVVIYATVHEFGSPKMNIPERSFIRATFDSKGKEIGDIIEESIIRYLDDELSFTAAMDFIGEYLVGLVKKTIADMDSPPLQPETIAAKGSSGVLVDTGRLIDSITYKVVER